MPPSTTTFAKKAETSATLVKKLLAQGLQVPDPASAQRYLDIVGHYRLKGYWFHLLDATTRRFPSGVSFEDLAARHEFDRKLRSTVTNSLERVEIGIRTVMSNHLSLKYGPHWFLDLRLFKSGREWSVGKMLQKIEQEVARAEKRKFVESFYNRYDEPHIPPSWAMIECMTFGMWSQTFKILRDPSDKKAIASKFGLDAEVFASWTHAITVLRNTVAHHDRLLRRRFHVRPMGCKARQIKFSPDDTFFAQSTVLHVLLDTLGEGSAFKHALATLLDSHPSSHVYKQELGFPVRWPSGAFPGW